MTEILRKTIQQYLDEGGDRADVLIWLVHHRIGPPWFRIQHAVAASGLDVSARSGAISRRSQRFDNFLMTHTDTSL